MFVFVRLSIVSWILLLVSCLLLLYRFSPEERVPSLPPVASRKRKRQERSTISLCYGELDRRRAMCSQRRSPSALLFYSTSDVGHRSSSRFGVLQDSVWSSWAEQVVP